MGILSEDMKRTVREQWLGYIGSVSPDGSPHVSPRATVTVWDDDHLVFAEIHSESTVANLRANAAVEINVVDPTIQKGYRFKGRAAVHTSGSIFDAMVQAYFECGIPGPIASVVLVTVEQASDLISPTYDSGISEGEVRDAWLAYWESRRPGGAAGSSRG